MTERRPMLYPFEDYTINELGMIRDYQGRLLTTYMDRGQTVLKLTGSEGRTKRTLARLVLENFEVYPNHPSDIIMHKDGDKWNCELTNLVWRPRHYAHLYYKQLDRARYEFENEEEFDQIYRPRPIIELNLNTRVRTRYSGPIEVALKYGIQPYTVLRAARLAIGEVEYTPDLRFVFEDIGLEKDGRLRYIQ